LEAVLITRAVLIGRTILIQRAILITRAVPVLIRGETGDWCRAWQADCNHGCEYALQHDDLLRKDFVNRTWENTDHRQIQSWSPRPTMATGPRIENIDVAGRALPASVSGDPSRTAAPGYLKRPRSTATAAAATTAAATRSGAHPRAHSGSRSGAPSAGRRIIRQRDTALACTYLHAFVMFRTNALPILLRLRAAHPVPVLIAFTIGHELGPIYVVAVLGLKLVLVARAVLIRGQAGEW
jgi:hypothetical protein